MPIHHVVLLEGGSRVVIYLQYLQLEPNFPVSRALSKLRELFMSESKTVSSHFQYSNTKDMIKLNFELRLQVPYASTTEMLCCTIVFYTCCYQGSITIKELID